MAVGINGVKIALLFFGVLQSLQTDTCVDLRDKDVIILKDSWGYVLGKSPECRVKISHGELYNSLLSPMNNWWNGQGQGHGCIVNGTATIKRKQPLPSSHLTINTVVVTCSLLFCRDIHPCPGPVSRSRKTTFPCIVCTKGVRRNSKAVTCDICEEWVHIACDNIPRPVYDKATEDGIFPYVCNRCGLNSVAQYVDPIDDPIVDISVDQHYDGSTDDPIVDNSNPGRREETSTPTQPQHGAEEGPEVSYDKFGCFKKKGLHFLHLNTRSLLPKIAELRIIAAESGAAVIAISESWLDASVDDSEIDIPNYVVHRRDRKRTGGGVCLYIRQDLAFNPRPDLDKDVLETLWVDILLPKTRPILVGVCYRPPKQCDFYELLEQSCNEGNGFTEFECVILGDYNTNVIKTTRRSALVTSMYNFERIFGLKQLITEPTRVCPTSESIIDLIFVSQQDKISQSGVIPIGLSDHMLTFCTRKVVKGVINKHKYVKLRSLKNYNKEIFVQELGNSSWSNVLDSHDVEESWSYFKHNFMSVLDRLAPFKELRVKQRSESWLTSDILELIRQRDRCLAKFRRSKSQSDYDQFLYLRNQVRYKKDKAKSKHYIDAVYENQNRPKKLWKVLKELGSGSKGNAKSSNIGLMIDNVLCFDKSKVADRFNSFFTEIASALVNKLPSCTGRFGISHINRYYQSLNVTKNMFGLTNVSEDQVSAILCKMSGNKATGLDNLPAKFVKDSTSIITKPLTHVINVSINSGCIPSDLKMARVVPLFKKKSKTDCGNYRPVSVLSIVSKVFERVVYDQMNAYMNEHNLLYELQSGFRSAFSTDTCLIHLTDFIKQESDKGNFTGMILLDLQKAFDTVNHGILLSKLQSLGFNDLSVQWFKSYLTGRTQVTDVDGVLSNSKGISCGVPQGSILGPLLFLIYVNDMRAAVGCKLLLYADDSALLVSGRDVSEIEENLSMELDSVCEWLTENKLSIHLGKTESILFATKRRLRNVNSINVSCNGNNIVSKANVSYLGVNLDQSLTGEDIANTVIAKSSNKLKFLYRNTRNFNLKTKKLLVSALIQSQFDYSCSSWYSGLSKKLKGRMQTMQNKIVRYMLNVPPRHHIGFEEFKSVGVLPVHFRVEQLKLGHMYNIVNGSAPDYMNFNICNVSNHHNHGTRGSVNSCTVPRVGASGSTSFFYTGIGIWNSLSDVIKQSTTKTAFKKLVKSYLWNKLELQSTNIYVY